MPKNALNTFSPSDYCVSTAPLGTTLPAVLPTSPTVLNLPTGYFDIGYLSDAGVSESHNYNETKVFDMAGRLLRILRNQEERPWTFECVENDAVSQGLMYPGSSVTTTGATAEVQTVTMTATGGTWTPALAGYPSPPAQTYNVATAALQTALRAAWDMPVVVTGTPGTSYVITFPAGAGDITTITLTVSALTGGTATIAVTTPGVTGVNTRIIGAGLARNIRVFVLDLFDGSLAERYILSQGESIWTGSVNYNGTSIKIAQFTLNPVFDPAINGFYQKLDNNPASALSFS